MMGLRCRTGKWMLWGGAALVGWLYWVGTRQRPATRQPAVEPIDTPEVMAMWQQASEAPLYNSLYAWIARYALHGRQRQRVLDVGSGPGKLALLMAGRPEVNEVTGIDLSSEMVDTARGMAEMTEANATFLQADGAEMPFDDNTFDLVVSTLSLHHWNDPLTVLREVQRVLAPGGRAVIVDLRRDACPVMLGAASVMREFLLPPTLRDTGEPIASFQASFTPPEAALAAFKAGWEAPRVSSGWFWLILETP